MSRVYRALEKAEREKQERLQKKTSLELPRETETLKKETEPLGFVPEEVETPSPPVRDDVRVLVPSEHPFAAEEFRKLKTQVFHWSPNPPHIVLVTSTTPGEGKTVVSVNLAMAISLEINKKAILVDADLRKPSIHFEKYKNSKGLSNYLTERTPLAEILIRSEAENLWIVPAGPPSRKSPELIGSKRMEEFLNSLREFGDDTYVIIDSSPLLATSEPFLLSKWVDGIILVVMADRTHREPVRRAIQSIDKQKIIGIVLNQKELKTWSYHSSYYYSYHHYYHR